ncbi:MAG: Uma2 family endonuclease [Acidobacteria bacterium]|nr:Uma2 family endonuclease [Acidobacteriota bacterium]
MASLPQTRTVTYEEWLALPEVEDAVEEVVNGEIRIVPPAKSRRARIVQRLNRALDRQLDPDRSLLLCCDFGLVIRKQPLTSRVPDIALWLENGRYTRGAILASGDPLKPRLFPNVLIDIASIWPD